MEAPELRRVTASEAELPFDLIITLALKAEALLGYSGLRQKLGLPPASLTRVLDELGIEPYQIQDVKEYKKRKVREVTNRVWQQFYTQAQMDMLDPGAVRGSFVRARWRKVPLPEYGAEVPEFVLSRAIEVKEHLPTAKFTVEYLEVEKRYDPFLIVSCGRERFYLDVWDEREFEERDSATRN